MPGIPKRLMGYSIQQVDQYLEKIRKRHQDEIAQFNDNIDDCRREREALMEELNLLKEARQQQPGNREILELALKRAADTGNLIGLAAKEEIDGILEESKQRVIIHDNYLIEVVNEIKKIRSNMYITLENVQQSVKEYARTEEEEPAIRKVVGTILHSAGKSESIISALGEDIMGNTVVLPSGSHVGCVDNLVINESTREIEGFHLKGSHPEGGWFIPASCIMAVKKESLVISPEWQKTSVSAGKKDGGGRPGDETSKKEEFFSKGRITADGWATTPVRSAGRQADGPTLTSINSEKSVNIGSPPHLVEEYVNPGSVVGGSGSFWEDTFDTGSGVFNCPEGENAEVASNSGGYDTRHEADGDMLCAREEVCTTKPAPVSEPEYQDNFYSSKSFFHKFEPEAPIENKTLTKPVDAVQKASPAVATEIKTVRHKYVVGKLAGEDLLDGSGQVIIGKNNPITPDVVERAEKEGKLAELIVHMVIPGLEE